MRSLSVFYPAVSATQNLYFLQHLETNILHVMFLKKLLFLWFHAIIFTVFNGIRFMDFSIQQTSTFCKFTCV